MAGTDTAQRAYIGSFTSAGGAGITVASLDAESGALRPRHSTDAVANPSYLALSAGGDILYAVCETDDGAAAALSVADPARPPALLADPVSVRGAGPTHLALAAGHLLTANYVSGSVTALPVRDGGVLGEPTALFQDEGGGPHPERQRGPHAHAVRPDPSGRWLLTVDLGTDAVRSYGLPGLRPHGAVRMRPGSGPRHLAFHPRGDRVYVINELEPTITICRWDAADGTLEPLGETPVLPDGFAGECFPSEVVVSGDGRFVWAAARGADTVTTFALDASGDRLDPVATTPCGGSWPRDLVLGPSGRHLYAANERSGDITWFTVDDATGVPGRAGSIEAPAASCVVFG
ncbi:lactonase family protein [Streptomyces sp. NA02950]|uniref:lactonase family protein n=1 Tax=Streptomyces sp. NA02950 TaxID=2742137 RepID=UPI001591EDEB|nr:lactonase family protein [Streptomyces sp. NA02950]QKV91496.1 lactonase family protein [Streptomyces sp. NA02950]